jgi:hypothetical protein
MDWNVLAAEDALLPLTTAAVASWIATDTVL